MSVRLGVNAPVTPSLLDVLGATCERASGLCSSYFSAIFTASASGSADVLVENRVAGRKTACDVSVVSPTHEGILHRSADIPAAAIEIRRAQGIFGYFSF